jgi:hypothetical protein
MAATEIKPQVLTAEGITTAQTIRKDDDGLNALLSRQREAIWGLMIALGSPTVDLVHGEDCHLFQQSGHPSSLGDAADELSVR